MSLQYLNNFRGIAILLIVFGHAVSALPQPHSSLLNALMPLFSNGTLLFVLVAGQFFVVLSENYSYKIFLKNKLMLVVLPYLILSLPAALIYLFQLKTYHDWMDMEWFNSLNPLVAYAYLFITGAHLGPLWFVPMILLYYLFSPLWFFLLRKDLLLPVFLLSLALAIYLGRPEDNANSLQSALYFLPAYLLGMYLGKRTTLLSFLMPYAVWGFIICVLVLIDYGYSIFSDTRLDLPLKLITTCFLIALCQAKLNFKIKWLDLFARLSFYLFFVHGYVIGAFRIYLRHSEHHYMGIGAALGIFITTLILCLTAYILFKWLFQNHSKFILGA
jgi:peptidoglycan/LPS O-acetylase OafA/YrhL